MRKMIIVPDRWKEDRWKVMTFANTNSLIGGKESNNVKTPMTRDYVMRHTSYVIDRSMGRRRRREKCIRFTMTSDHALITL